MNVVTTDEINRILHKEIEKTYNQKKEEQKDNWSDNQTSVELMVLDNFYENPMHTRAFALTQEFTQEGNYPGQRTKPFPYENWGKHIEEKMNIKIKKDTWFDDKNNGAFQSIKKGVPTWVHADVSREYSCIIFLNPYAPPNSGTSFYEHRESGSRIYNDSSKWLNSEVTEYGKGNLYSCRDDIWRRVDTISNKFNRAVIFKGNLWHAADEYFGYDLESSRLTQTFFFDSGGKNEF
tara:strand:+ start:2132 stop:2836 length:705 start_codon:yes stop_codon:yes gene_type:complete